VITIDNLLIFLTLMPDIQGLASRCSFYFPSSLPPIDPDLEEILEEYIRELIDYLLGLI